MKAKKSQSKKSQSKKTASRKSEKNLNYTFGKDSIQLNSIKKWDSHHSRQVVFLDFDQRKKLLPLLEDHPLAQKVLEAKLQELEPTEKKPEKGAEKGAEKTDFTFIDIHFEGDGFFKAFLAPRKLTTYDFHTELRKNLSAVFSPSETENKVVQVHIKELAKHAEIAVLDACVSLTGLNYFRPETFGKKAKKVKPYKTVQLDFYTGLSPKEFKNTALRSQVIASAMNHVRYLADLPGNELRPAHYQERVQEFAREMGASYEFLDVGQLRRKNAEAFLAVIAADPNSKGGIAIVRSKKKAKKKLVLVGKGLCFDTGGYNVKTGGYMETMHRDMTGSALALGIFEAVVRLDLNIEVEAHLALAENLISEHAYKPNDVVTASNGLSIEVIDTDAEGRMVLSDTLALASKSKPDLLLDFATLTGAAIRAIDTRRSAVFSTDINLSVRAVHAGNKVGERVWHFPIGEDYNEALKSDVADLRQCASTNNCDHIYAATFLSKFVEKDVPWVHLDLVSAENKGGLGLVSTSTTGFGVRWALEMIDNELT